MKHATKQRNHYYAVHTGFLTNSMCGTNIQFTSCFNILCHNIRSSLSSTVNNKHRLFKTITVISTWQTVSCKLQTATKSIIRQLKKYIYTVNHKNNQFQAILLVLQCYTSSLSEAFSLQKPQWNTLTVKCIVLKTFKQKINVEIFLFTNKKANS